MVKYMFSIGSIARVTLILLPLLLCHASTQDATIARGECELSPDGSCKGHPAGVDVSVGKASDDEPPECGLYMAPSTLGEDTNMGMYAGKAYSAEEVLNWPEIAIPLLFREWGEHRSGFSDGEIWDRYIWEGSVASLNPYDDTNRENSRAVFVPGIGCTINSILDMNNIESTKGSLYDTAGLHRSRDPGVGAFTPYHASNTTAVVDIPAGAEIFASYGGAYVSSPILFEIFA